MKQRAAEAIVETGQRRSSNSGDGATVATEMEQQPI